MQLLRTDLILVRCKAAQAEGLHEVAQRFCAASGLQLRPQRIAWSAAPGWTYAYFVPASPLQLDASQPRRLAALWSSLSPSCTDVDVSRMEILQEQGGHSHGATPRRHYVVETDPEAGWEDEIVRWYVEEHMPGLAAVPGCVDARRLRNHDAGPRSHACYSLVTEDTLGSPPWLAVRHTDWSSRVRPHFTNTRRTMMEVVPQPAASVRRP